MPQAPSRTLAGTLSGLACNEAGHAAEQAKALPDNLLLSIGLVESGRRDPVDNHITPWPWTVNVDGVGRYFDNEKDAAGFAQQAESAGARDVDVGCFQISLESHPAAFPSIDAAFDPAGNADFAAYFLNELKFRTGSWEAAIADYHSALPEIGLPYRQRVLAAWQRIGGAPPGMPDLFSLADPTIIVEGPAARLVQVITCNDETALPVLERKNLPRVITP